MVDDNKKVIHRLPLILDFKCNIIELEINNIVVLTESLGAR